MPRSSRALAACLLLAVGCSDRADPPKATGAGTASASAAASAAPSAAPSAAASQAPVLPSPPERVADDDWTRLLPGARPVLPPPLAGLTFSQNRAAIQKVLGDALAADGTVTLPTLAALPTRLGFHEGTEGLRFVQLTVPEAAMAALLARWGAPTKAKLSPARDGLWWLGDGLQVVFETRGPRHYLTFWPLMTAEALVGHTKGRPGFERDGQALLGAEGAAVMKAFIDAQPRARPGSLDLHLPPHERRAQPTIARLTVDPAGVVQGVALTLTYDADKALRDAVLLHLGQVYGAAKVVGTVHTFPGLVVNDREAVGRLHLQWGDAVVPASPTQTSPASKPVKPALAPAVAPTSAPAP